MSEMDSDAKSAVLLAVTNSVMIFGLLLPELAEVRKSDPDDTEKRADVHLGEAASAALVIAIGFIATNISKSKAPLIVSVFSAAVLVGMYESVLNHKSK